MIQKRIIIFGVLLLSTLAIAASTKGHTWQTGILEDVSSERGSRTIGTFNNGHGSVVQRRDDATYYKIQTPEYTYTAKRSLTRRGDKQLAVTVNDPIKFAIEGEDFYLMDENGKEHKLTLERKSRNRPPNN